MSELYDGYKEFKKWDTEEASEKSNVLEEYRGEFRGIGLKGKKVLEIGFGRGYFLDYARTEGADVYGIEIIEEFFDRKKLDGHNVYLGYVDEIADINSRSNFDIIVAFDVFEHIELNTLKKYLSIFHDTLSRNGIVVARFPNSQSPFALHCQNGDFTHVNAMSIAKMEQLITTTGFELIRSGNAYREMSGSPAKKLKKFLAYRVRDFFEILIGHLYFRRRFPLDPVCTIVIKKVS